MKLIGYNIGLPLAIDLLKLIKHIIDKNDLSKAIYTNNN